MAGVRRRRAWDCRACGAGWGCIQARSTRTLGGTVCSRRSVKFTVALLASSLSVAALIACQTPSAVVLNPPCSVPAPLLGKFDRRAPGYIIMLRKGFFASDEGSRLALKHGFTPSFVGTRSRIFSGNFEPTTIAALRCEPSVELIEFNQIGTLSGTGAT